MFHISDNYLSSLMEEDLQLMDLTVMSMNIESVPAMLECHPKKNCILAGVEEASRLFEKTGSSVEILCPQRKFDRRWANISACAWNRWSHSFMLETGTEYHGIFVRYCHKNCRYA